jgi:hypothetical protein
MAVSGVLSIAATAWLVALYLAIGHGAYAFFRLRRDPELLGVLVRFALGFACVGNAVMALCFLQLASARSIVLLLIICSGFIVAYAPRVAADAGYVWGRTIGVLRDSHPAAAILLCVLGAGYGVRGLLPPSSFDVMMYHLAVPKLYLKHGGFWDIFFNPQADFPMLTQMHYMIGLALGNDIVCRSIAFVLGMAAVAVIALLCTRLFAGRRIIAGSILVFLSSTVVIASMSTCYVDIPQAVWTVLAVCALERYLAEKSRPYLLMSGVLSGMAVQSKVFGLFVLPLVVVRLWMERRGKILTPGALRELAVILAPALIMGLPWYIKSVLYNGSALTIGHGLIEGQGLAAPMGMAGVSGAMYWAVNGVLRVVAAPWTFTLFPGQHQGDTLGPLFICVLPMLALVRRPSGVNRILVMMAVFAACVLFMEMVFVQGGASARYGTTLLILGAPMIVWTAGSFNDFPRLKTLMKMMIVCTVCIGSLIFLKRYHKDWIAVLTLKSRDEYLESVLPEYPAVRFLNGLTDGKAVMPVYNFSNYHLDIPYIAAYRHYSSEQEILTDFREKNIGYIFANNTLNPEGNKNAFSGFSGKECVFEKNGFYVFKVDAQ